MHWSGIYPKCHMICIRPSIKAVIQLLGNSLQTKTHEMQALHQNQLPNRVCGTRLYVKIILSTAFNTVYGELNVGHINRKLESKS